MLIPLRVAHVYERIPVATWALIGINVGMYVLTVAVGLEGLRSLVLDADAFGPHQLLTSMFLHAGIVHLLGNMLFLWVYGRYVEERLGPGPYVAIYLACGVVGDLFFLTFTGGRSVGASGAIAGLMGFVLVGAPWAEVRLLFLWVPYGAFTRTLDVAAFWLVGWWILFQLVNAAAGMGAVSRVAYAAHIGGCFAGAGIAWYLRSPARLGTPWYLDPSPPGGGPEATRRLRRARGRRSRAPEESRFVVVFQAIDGAPSRVAVIRLLMTAAELEPEAAHRRLEHVEAGVPQPFVFAEADVADRFAREARRLGVRVTLEAPAATQAPPTSIHAPKTSEASEPIPMDWQRPVPSPAPESASPPGPQTTKSGEADEQKAKKAPPIRLASGEALELEEDAGEWS